MTSKPNEIVMMHEESSSKSSIDCCGEEKKMSDGCGGADDQVVRNEKLPMDLMASRGIIDYVIDINIYRHLLKIKILYLRKQFINYGLMYFNYIRPLTKTKFNNNRIIENRPNQNYRLLHSYNSLFLNETKRLLHVDQQTAFTFCKTIVTSSLEMLVDVGLINNLIHDTLWEKGRISFSFSRCTKCTFYHDQLYTDTAVTDLLWRYPLLSHEQCTFIINNCTNKKACN